MLRTCSTDDSHNFYDGPPYLRCSCPHGLIMLHALYPTEEREMMLRSPDLSVWVDWGHTSVPGTACRLSIRRFGCEVAHAADASGAPMRVDFARGASSTVFLAELSWRGGWRRLHVIPPPTGSVALCRLVLPPGSHVRGLAALQAHIQAAAGARAPAFPSRTAELERGFGVEIELLTEAAAWPLLRSNRAQMRAVIDSLHLATDTHEGEACDAPSLAPIRAALLRCEHWLADTDLAIQPSPPGIAARTLDATCAVVDGAATPDEEERAASLRARCFAMLRQDGATRRSEFQSPRPPHELRFSRGAALEMACFVDGLLASTGAVAASISAAGHCATALHVHVNCRSPVAGGRLLSAMDICSVLFAWIRFDLVTQSFARPWVWCEPSCTPLYATGVELGTLDHLVWEAPTEAQLEADLAFPGAHQHDYPAAHELGSRASASVAPEASHAASSARETADDSEADERAHKKRKLGNVPSMVRAMHEIVHAHGFAQLSETDKIDELFGIGCPGSEIGRNCSLNLLTLAKYGTLEFRRFHGTLDSTLLVQWAHFCVAFVEAFAGTPSDILGRPSSEAAVLALQRAQETASADELMACMAGYVDPGTAKYFERDMASC